MDGEFYSDTLNATNSTKALFDLYKIYGDNFIHEIDGIFNICIYDKNKKSLKIFNDWSGNHNLYYYYFEEDKQLVFSTEMKGILKVIQNKSFNYQAAFSQVMFSHLLFNDTLINEVKLLPPASILEYSRDRLSIKNYYDLKYHYEIISGRSEKYFIDTLYDYFEQPTKKYLEKGKISLPITGGMDSRFLLHLLLKNDYPVWDTFTGGSPKSEEVRIARKITSAYSAPHRIADSPEDYFCDKFYDNYYIHEGLLSPYRFSSGLELHYKKGVNYIIQFPNSNLTLGDLYTPATKHFIGEYKLTDRIKENIFNKFLKVNQEILNSLFTDSYHYFSDIQDMLYTYYDELRDFPSAFIFDYFAWYQHSRRWSNIGGMNGKFIGRIAPSQDRTLNEFIFNIPIKYKYWQYIHKQMFKTKCPELAKFPREGTGVPISWPEPVQMVFKAYRKRIYNKYIKKIDNTKRISKFYRNFVKDKIDDVIYSKSLQERGIFNHDFVKKIWEEHLAGKNNTYLIHNILNIELFHRNYLD